MAGGKKARNKGKGIAEPVARNRQHPYRSIVLPTNAPFKLDPSSIPGAGWGAFAIKNIRAGEIVLEEKAIFVVKHATDHANPHLQYREAREMDMTMTQFQKDQLALLRIDGDRNQPMDVGQILSMSTWGLVSKDSGDFLGHGIFLLASRFNHTCQPNMHISPKTDENDVLHTMALRDIQVGEELTHHYHDFLECLTRAERHAILEFVCQCSLCCADDETVKLSDSRRILIRGLCSLIFGKDIAANYFAGRLKTTARVIGARKVEVLSKTLVHVCCALALVEEEKMMDSSIADRVEELVGLMAPMFEKEDHKMLLHTMREKKTWAARFLVVQQMYGHKDPFDNTTHAEKFAEELDRRGGVKYNWG